MIWKKPKQSIRSRINSKIAKRENAGLRKEQYDVKELTKAMLGANSKSNPSGQQQMLNKLEGDLEFLNRTLGSTPQK